MTRQLTKSRDFRQIYLCDFHLSSTAGRTQKIFHSARFSSLYACSGPVLPCDDLPQSGDVPSPCRHRHCRRRWRGFESRRPPTFRGGGTWRSSLARRSTGQPACATQIRSEQHAERRQQQCFRLSGRKVLLALMFFSK